jgi:anti-sigma B factor antagonist
MPFSYEIKPALVGTLVVLEGEIDLDAAPRLRHVLHREIAAHSGQVVLDLTGVHFVDSAGLGVLIGGTRRCRESGGDLTLRNVRPMILRLIRHVRLDQVLTIQPLEETDSELQEQ